MARPRKLAVNTSPASSPGLQGWAEMLGEAMGRGVARGINAGLGVGAPAPSAPAPSTPAPIQVGVRRRGRPPRAKTAGGPVPPDRACKVDGCPNEARSKGLCSKHYQAERRRILGKSKGA